MSKKTAAAKRTSKGKSAGHRISAGIRELVDDMKAGRPIEEKYNVRRVTLEINPGDYLPKHVVETRLLLGLSQALFAQFLGVSTNAVQTWEQGQKPSGMACRFMDEIRRDPAYSAVKRVAISQPAAGPKTGHAGQAINQP